MEIRQFLENQHRAIDNGLLGVLDGSAGPDALGTALGLLRQHIYLEEALLFGALETEGLAMPVFVMKREHGQMWPLLDVLIDAAHHEPSDALRDGCRTLYQLLQMHNPKEEEIVYGALTRLPEAARQPLATLEAARVPEDWRCAAAAH